LGGFFDFWAKARLSAPGDNVPDAFSGDSFQKSTVFDLRGVAPQR
jgi:hypothetical protein